ALLIASTAAMARAIDVPLSVDIEGGYSDAPEAVAELAAALIDAGAVGINIEDGSAPPALLAAKIAAIRAAADAAGVHLFINARCDVFLRQLQPAPGAVAEALHRATRYHVAGADGLFVPGVPAADFAAIVAGSALPVNIMARPDIPAAAALQALGVRRLSAGSGIAQAMWATVETLATDFLASGDSGPVSAAGAFYPRLNAVMRGSD
ncbi:MAG: isocitrate lyase/phosphoenolpyruvate mutase family protein, partial [Polymorphobacter sp.]